MGISSLTRATFNIIAKSSPYIKPALSKNYATVSNQTPTQTPTNSLLTNLPMKRDTLTTLQKLRQIIRYHEKIDNPNKVLFVRYFEFLRKHPELIPFRQTKQKKKAGVRNLLEQSNNAQNVLVSRKRMSQEEQDVLRLLESESIQPKRFQEVVEAIVKKINSLSFPDETLSKRMEREHASIFATSKIVDQLATDHQVSVNRNRRNFSLQEQENARNNAQNVAKRAKKIIDVSNAEGVRFRILLGALVGQAVTLLSGSVQLGLASGTAFQMGFYTKLKKAWNSMLTLFHYYPGSYRQVGPNPPLQDLFLQHLYGIKGGKPQRDEDWVLNGPKQLTYVMNGKTFKSDGLSPEKMENFRKICANYILSDSTVSEQEFQKELQDLVEAFRNSFKPVDKTENSLELQKRRKFQQLTEKKLLK